MKAATGAIVISTFSDEKSLRKVAGIVLEERLCACVSYSKVRSLYLWKGRREAQAEYLALFKSTGKSAGKLKRAIQKHHPYEVPEIVELRMDGVASSYLAWLAAETLPERVPEDRNDP